MFTKRTLNEIDLGGKRVLMRADYNVPLTDEGEIADDYRIRQSLPTLYKLLENGCKVVVCSHLGRPKGPDDKSVSLKPVATRLAELLERDVDFAHDCIGDEVREKAEKLDYGQVLLIEDVRYHKEEEENSAEFAKAIVDAAMAEIFVQDAFGVVHRAHATTAAITQFLPSVAGYLLEREVDTITRVMEQPERPLMAIVGGAKISDKIEVLNRFVEIADVVAVVGAMANTFLLAEGYEVGESLVEADKVDTAREIMAKAKQKNLERPFTFFVPRDAVVADKIENHAATRIVDLDTHSFADIQSYPHKPRHHDAVVGKHERILDIGPVSAGLIAGMAHLSRTVVWNGTAGVAELKGLAGAADPFGHGTKLIVEALIGENRQVKNRPFTVVGGGDTVDYVNAKKLADEFGHVSTGGGASLELMGGRELPGVTALWDKEWH